MRRLIFFLEEPSAEEMLKGILPKILPEEVFPEYKVFEGKQDLEKRLPILLKAWRVPDCSFLVMRDQDSGDCRVIKAKLASLCQSAAGNYTPILIRIACRELESFYLGDLAAVQKGLGISGLTEKQNIKKFREPDKLGNPSGELKWLTAGNYQKILGSRAIAPHLDLEGNRSHSFRVLVSGIRKLIQSE